MKGIYCREKLSAERIRLEKIRMEFYNLLINPDENQNELMSWFLNYLKNFWNQISTNRNS